MEAATEVMYAKIWLKIIPLAVGAASGKSYLGPHHFYFFILKQPSEYCLGSHTFTAFSLYACETAYVSHIGDGSCVG